MTDPTDRRYTREDADAILRRALDRQATSATGDAHSAFTHQELAEIASELGVSREALDAAAIDVLHERQAIQRREQTRVVLRRRFFSEFAQFSIINAVLFWLDVSTPGGPWFYWVLGPWSVFFAIRWIRAFQSKTDDAAWPPRVQP